ncbi:MAG TPA: hypothetical protein VN903_26845 [Polyangia bacterium]|nr:hypothetical protein [Polyangia bacterium]
MLTSTPLASRASTSLLATGFPWASTTVTVTGVVTVIVAAVQPGTVQLAALWKRKPMPNPGVTKSYVPGTIDRGACPLASVQLTLT